MRRLGGDDVSAVPDQPSPLGSVVYAVHQSDSAFTEASLSTLLESPVRGAASDQTVTTATSEKAKLMPSSGQRIYLQWQADYRDGLFHGPCPETNEDWSKIWELADAAVLFGSWQGEEGAKDVPQRKMVVRWNIEDGPVPLDAQLSPVVSLVAGLVSNGVPTYVGCPAGVNRSGLLTALVVRELTGVTGQAAADHVRGRRPGALINGEYNKYLNDLPELEAEVFPELSSE